MARGLEEVAALPDPLGRSLAEWTRPNGLVIRRVPQPLGVLGMIYESRPNVGADAAAIAIKSGNAILLRGGSESFHSAAAIHQAIIAGLRAAGLPEDVVQVAPSTDRGFVAAMLAANGLIDLIIPRGGKSLVERVQREARVPVLSHAEGLNHTYIHAAADFAMARSDPRQRENAPHRHLRRDRDAAAGPRHRRPLAAGPGLRPLRPWAAPSAPMSGPAPSSPLCRRPDPRISTPNGWTRC